MPKKKDTNLNIRLPGDLAAAAKKKAARLDVPLSQVVRDFLKRWSGEPGPGRMP